jgi:hypothetical protein
MANAKAMGLAFGLVALPLVAGCPLPDAKPLESDGGATSSTTGSGGEGGVAASSSSAGGQGGMGGAGGMAASSSGTGGAGGGCMMPAGCGGAGCPPCPTLVLLATGASGGITGKFDPASGWSTAMTPETSGDVPALAFADSALGVGVLRASDKNDQLRFATYKDGFGVFGGVGPGISSKAAPSAAGSADAIHMAFLGTDNRHYYASYKAVWQPSAEPVLANGVHSFGFTPAAIAARGDEVVLAYMGSDGKAYDQPRKAGVWAAASAHGAGNLSGPPAIVALAAGPEFLMVFSVQPKGPLQWMTRSLGIWTAPTPIAGTPAAEPALVALPSGAAVLAYRDLTTNALSWARFEAGAWSAPKPVASQPLAYANSRPALAPGVADAEAELAFVDPLGTSFHCRLQGDAFSAPASVGGTSLKVVAIAKGP